MLRNKKGQVGLETILYVLAFIFAAAIFIFIIYYAYGQIKDPIAGALNSTTTSSEDIAIINNAGIQTIGGLGIFNVLFPFLLVGLIAMTIISAFFMGSHPVFFFVSLILLGVVIMLGVVFSNVYQQITYDDNFNNTASTFSVMNLFMKYLPIIMAVIIILVMIVLWGKPGGGATSGI